MDNITINDDDFDLLLNVLSSLYGYDFTNYARASLKRRVNRLMIIDKFPAFDELLHKLKTDDTYLNHFIEEITVNVTEMFRDPSLYKTLREKVLPSLGTHPFIRIWHAGCSTGEEVYSMAILLKEANLLHKSLLYATDINPSVIENIRRGIFPLSNMKQYSENYIEAGGKEDFSSYYTANYGAVQFDRSLQSRMVVATHNLVSDRSFNEFQLIFCRNVLIYFDKDLQDKVLTLFNDSMDKLGFLVLGAKENIRFSTIDHAYSQIEKTEKIWRKTS